MFEDYWYVFVVIAVLGIVGVLLVRRRLKKRPARVLCNLCWTPCPVEPANKYIRQVTGLKNRSWLCRSCMFYIKDSGIYGDILGSSGIIPPLQSTVLSSDSGTPPPPEQRDYTVEGILSALEKGDVAFSSIERTLGSPRKAKKLMEDLVRSGKARWKPGAVSEATIVKGGE